MISEWRKCMKKRFLFGTILLLLLSTLCFSCKREVDSDSSEFIDEDAKRIVVTPEDVDTLDITTEFGKLAIIAKGDFKNKFVVLSNVIKSYSDRIIFDMSGVSGISKIPDGAFKDCKSISKVIFPKSIKAIGVEAFSGCSGMASVNIPNGVTVVDNSAFYGCGLYEITIPSSVTYIGYNAFGGSGRFGYSIKKINYKGNLEQWCSKTWSSGELSSSYDLFINDQKITDLVIPENVTIIKSLFRNCTSLISVTIPEGVESIESGAFYGCTSLVSITIPSSLNAVSRDSFGSFASNYEDERNSKIETINYKGTLEQWFNKKWNSQYVTWVYWLYINDKLITDVVVPESITNISSNVFSRCRLNSVTIPNSVTSIESEAFSNCYMNEITIPFVGTSADATEPSASTKFIAIFGKTIPSSLKKVTITGGKILDDAFEYDYSNPIETIIILDGVTSIGKYAFYNFKELTSITIPNSVTDIGAGAFYKCTGLTSITIPASVVIIKTNAFSGCSNLSSAIFMDADNWYSKSTTSAPDSKVDLSDSSIAAQLLKQGKYLYKAE